MMNTRFDRRRFLRGVALGGAAGLVSTFKLPPARADGAVPLKAIVCHMRGAFDVLMSTDSRDPANQGGCQLALDRQALAMFQNQPAPMGLTDPAGNLWRHGPAFEPMRPIMLDTSIKKALLNGVVTNTVSHTTGQVWINTGLEPAGDSNPRGSSLGTLVAAKTGRDKLLPHIANIDTYNDGKPSYASAIQFSAPSDFVQILGPGLDPRFTGPMRAELRHYQSDRSRCQEVGTDPKGVGAKYFASKQQWATVSGSGIGSIFNLFDPAAPADVVAVRNQFNVDPNNPGAPAAVMASLALGLQHDIFDAATVTLGDSFDTHGPEWGQTQCPDQYAAWQALATFLAYAKNTTLSDGSTVLSNIFLVLTSEFARTPMLNGIGGRDHHPVRSVFCVMGNGRMASGIFGGSSTNLLPLPIDRMTGAPLAGGTDFINVGAVYTTLFRAAGYPEESLQFREQALPFLAG